MNSLVYVDISVVATDILQWIISTTFNGVKPSKAVEKRIWFHLLKLVTTMAMEEVEKNRHSDFSIKDVWNNCDLTLDELSIIHGLPFEEMNLFIKRLPSLVHLKNTILSGTKNTSEWCKWIIHREDLDSSFIILENIGDYRILDYNLRHGHKEPKSNLFTPSMLFDIPFGYNINPVCKIEAITKDVNADITDFFSVEK